VVSSHHGIRQLWVSLTRNIVHWKRERSADRAAGFMGRCRSAWPDLAQLVGAVRSAIPALVFGLRLWAAVCLALYVAFWLQLDDAQWAGTSAAIVCQPSLGASLRRGSARMVGTAIGAVAIVVLTGFFPQSRSGFLLGLALWGAACGFFATILRNNASYAAALAGYTAAIIASDLLGPTGGTNGSVLILAIDRASEICIGIVCAGIVFAGTDFGNARHRLAAQFAAVAVEITKGFVSTFSLAGSEQSATRLVRRRLVACVIALGPVIDEATGETDDLRYRWRGLQAAVDGLFAATSSWRAVATNLELMPHEQGRREANVILQTLPRDLRSEPTQGDAATWAAEPSRIRLACRTGVRALLRLPTATPSLRLMADATAEALLGISRALDGLSLLANPARVVPPRRVSRFRMPDPLPACITAVRVFVAIAAVELFWIVTAWPSGALAIAFAAIGIILLSPREDQAYAGAQTFMLGISLATILAGTIEFAVLPGVQSFAGFCLAIGLVLVPVAALATQTWQGPVFATTANVFFIPLLAPANQMTYDTQQFYNNTLAVVSGMGAVMLALVLLPPLSPAFRTRRLLALILRDMRRLAAGKTPSLADDWEGGAYRRLNALPQQVEPVQLARIVAAASVGTEIIRLRHIARRLGLGSDTDIALAAISQGDNMTATERLAQVDRRLAALPEGTEPRVSINLRARGSIRVIQEALAQHGSYFESGALR
jgi:uncharacterized membrane protein YccC